MEEVFILVASLPLVPADEGFSVVGTTSPSQLPLVVRRTAALI
jgi:hypothetical protein